MDSRSHVGLSKKHMMVFVKIGILLLPLSLLVIDIGIQFQRRMPGRFWTQSIWYTVVCII